MMMMMNIEDSSAANYNITEPGLLRSNIDQSLNVIMILLLLLNWIIIRVYYNIMHSRCRCTLYIIG